MVACISHFNMFKGPTIRSLGGGISFADKLGGGPGVVVSTAAFHARVRGSVPGLGGLNETKDVSPPSTCESQYCGEPPPSLDVGLYPGLYRHSNNQIGQLQ